MRMRRRRMRSRRRKNNAHRTLMGKPDGKMSLGRPNTWVGV
jgi:hypothetical protein